MEAEMFRCGFLWEAEGGLTAKVSGTSLYLIAVERRRATEKGKEEDKKVKLNRILDIAFIQ